MTCHLLLTINVYREIYLSTLTFLPVALIRWSYRRSLEFSKLEPAVSQPLCRQLNHDIDKLLLSYIWFIKAEWQNEVHGIFQMLTSIYSLGMGSWVTFWSFGRQNHLNSQSNDIRSLLFLFPLIILCLFLYPFWKFENSDT